MIKLNNKPKALIYGIGINDSDYQTQVFSGRKLVWVCPYYKKWKSMLSRCYSEYVQENRPTYKGSEVCSEWLTFSSFKAWVCSFGFSEEKVEYYHLDKDILSQGNKIYSPEFSRLVHPRVNGFVVYSKNKASALPLGVFHAENEGQYQVKCSNPITGKNKRVGRYYDLELAVKEYRKTKLQFAIDLIDAGLVGDSDIANAIIKRYKD